MAASDEHTFLSNAFIDVASRLSESQLYGFREANRSTYDFACNLAQTRGRAVVGQTLWGHHEGILKDIISLQTNQDGPALGVYLFPDTLKARRAIDEALQQLRRVRPGPLVAFRMIPVPPDFNANSEADRALMANHIRQRVSEDIILRIVLGSASADDINRFQLFANIPGMLLAIMDAVHAGAGTSVSELSSRLSTAKTTTVS